MFIVDLRSPGMILQGPSSSRNHVETHGFGDPQFSDPPLKHCFKGYPIPASPTEERFVTADGQADADGPRQRLGRKREGHQVGEGRRLVPNEAKKVPLQGELSYR